LTEARMPGVGLRSMRERAEELGGTLVLEASVGGGTQMRVQLPVQRNGAR
jgi:two-component system NarL family sensor kinase